MFQILDFKTNNPDNKIKEYQNKIRQALSDGNYKGKSVLNLDNGDNIILEKWFGGHYNLMLESGGKTIDLASNVSVDKAIKIMLEQAGI